MELAIRSVRVDGKNYTINTAGTQERGEQGLGANRRTAEMVGGGAAGERQHTQQPDEAGREERRAGESSEGESRGREAVDLGG